VEHLNPSSQRFDPYKNFKFQLKWGGRNVAGVSKVMGLKRASGAVKQGEGVDLSSSRKLPGRTKYEAITLERGVTHDVEFGKWANQVSNAGAEMGSETSLEARTDLILEVYDEAGQLAITYKIFRCWVSEFQAVADLDASGNAVAIEHLKIESEGWERDPAPSEPVAYQHTAGEGLREFARRVEVVASWQDLTIPERQKSQLGEVVAQVRLRPQAFEDWEFIPGNECRPGVSVLFSGGTGTGRTVAAQILAGELGLDLYRIDLTKLISKYIGETEKNLSRVFGDARQGAPVLLFDEAEGLFGKRSEVKDSHDRYASTQVSELLRHAESYQGLTILAVNTKQAIDAGLLQRLHFVVEFPSPDSR
jgi:phage tail-like protein